MSQQFKTVTIWVLIFVVIAILVKVFTNYGVNVEKIDQSEFYDLVEKSKIAEVKITGDVTGYSIEGKLREKGSRSTRDFTTYIVKDEELPGQLRESGVLVKAERPKDSPLIYTLLTFYAPILLLIGLWVFFMRQMQTGGNKALSFGKSKAKLSSTQGKKVTFKDVAGVDEAKEELREIIEFLKDPQKFQKLGGKIPKGVLLMGAPGTGKTLLARAISGEANVPFFSISGSDFVEMFVGVGASRVRDLFEQGKKNAPCIIFIDEIDAVGRHRGAGLGGGHDEREQTLNQLLVEMDGFESNDGVILIAATNRPDVLDPALLRPGRFDRRVVVARPDVRGREEILQVHTRRIPLGVDVDLSTVARGTPGFSGADIANLVNEAALYAARLSKKIVEAEDFEIAKDKVMMGSERRSMIISDEEKKTTAYHEAGHAIVAHLNDAADPLHKVTIIPRGMALGVTQQLPLDEKHTYSRKYLMAMITVCMGGRISEEIFLDMLTSGAGNDFEKATEIARKMVCEWGMSDTMGPLTFGKKEEQIFLGREIAQHQDYSEATAVEIDREVRRIINDCYQQAREVITTNRDALVRIAEALLVREVLSANDIELLVRGEDLPPLVKATPPKTGPEAPDSEKSRDRKPRLSEKPILADPLEQPS